MAVIEKATICVTANRLIAQPDGTFTVRLNDGTVLSIQPDGSLGFRPSGTAGPWEKARRLGNKLVWSDPAYPFGGYALLVAD